MKKILVTLCVLFSVAAAHSQEMNMSDGYKTAVGVKVYPGALTVKHFLSPGVAIEGLGYFWQYGTRVTGLYELNANINGVDGLKWYIGAGAHAGFYNPSWTRDYPSRTGGIDIGVDGILGLDYKITGAPLDISFDWQPSFNVGGYTYFEGGWGGLALRFAF